MKPTGEYKKHVYWLAPEEAEQLHGDLKGRGIRVSIAKGVVCTPLDEMNRISIVPAHVWNETCARPGSWYRKSGRNGLSLVVSSFDVESIRRRKAAVITRSDFVPPRGATLQEKKEMTRESDFESLIPHEWGLVSEREQRIYLRWAARLGSDVKEYSFLFLTHTANHANFINWAARLGSDVKEYSFLFLTHTANHANFINPRFFLEHNGYRVPYSIDVSAHICSCCLELFQVLGSQHRRKLVRPCPGAVIFARLKPNGYLLVESPELQ